MTRERLVTLGLAVLELGAVGGCVEPQLVAARAGLPSAAARRHAAALPGVEAGSNCIRVTDALLLASWLAASGASEYAISRVLDWRLFEALVARALEEAGMRVWQGLRRPGPGGYQVDVLAVDASTAVAVECKHWRRGGGPSALRAAARRHIERVRRLATDWQRQGLPDTVERIIPVLIALRANTPPIVEGAVVAPVSKLRGLIEALPELAHDPRVAAAKPKKQ